jgi:hypothetical protein
MQLVAETAHLVSANFIWSGRENRRGLQRIVGRFRSPAAHVAMERGATQEER